MQMPLSNDVLDRAFRKARTYNSYTKERVTEATLYQLYDLLKWGPTSTNQQPQRIIWCVSESSREELASLCFPGNAEKVRRAPVAAVLGMETNFIPLLPRLFPHADARGWYGDNQRLIEESAFRNASLQAGYLIIAARLLGLDTNPMSGFDENAVNARFFANTTVRVNFITTLGYGDAATLYPRAPRLAFNEANTVL